MSYAKGHPVRIAGGRLALDLVNTANWSDDGQVVHEKIESLEDAKVWLKALGMSDATLPSSAEELRAFRLELRQFLRSEGRPHGHSIAAELSNMRQNSSVEQQPLTALAAMSAMSLVADRREMNRVKTCPADNCGWMFVDETKNSRRIWCLMETCGNRAKASRHYQKSKAGRSST